MSPRIVLVQPECKHRVGHPYAAIKSLETAIAPIEPLFCIHRRASEALDLAEDRTIRHFSGRISASPSRFDGDAPVTVSAFGELEALFRRLDLRSSDQVVFLSANAETVLALIELLKTRNAADWPHCHLRFIGDELRPDCETGAHKLLSDIRRRTNKLHLYAEFTANIRRHLRYYDGDPFELVRLPTLWPDRSDHDENPSVHRKFVIGVFGQPRRDKGKYRLAPIFSELFARNRRDGTRAPIEVQMQSDSRRNRQLHLRALFALALGTKAGRVRFTPANVSNLDFVSRLRRCDVVLLPYLPKTYTARGSGIVIDAVAHGVPIVCTSDTAMCELIGSGNGLSASSDREFVECLLTIASEQDRFRAAARAAASHARVWSSASLILYLRNLQSKPI